jgi:hypothetical protein
MSYQKLLNSKILQAFNLLKDLATEAIFIDTTVSGFNFDTATIEKEEAKPVSVKMVVVKTKKKDTTITKEVLARFVDTGILDEYDTLTFENKTWKLGSILQEVGQVIMFEIYREDT